MCGIRHDLKNHFATIGALIDEEPQKAHEYIKSLTQNQLQSVIRFVKTDNDSFNAIANAKIAVCEREGIKVQTRIKNNSLSRLADDEIGIIFGNLFDNAIEAARQAEDKQINLDVTIKGEYLSIIMTNSVQGSVLADNKSLETTKKNKSLHGYGTKSINRIVKKYDGMINYFEENGLFGCQILI
ncbi:MAG: GHKL domain-containing protein [Clostridia bacterium]|nr:GHKL domain-containing protein [Clostridia bacterium]